MKKIRDYYGRILLGFFPKQTIRVMKLTLFLSILTIFQLWATETYSQMTKLTLKLEDAKISDALKEIENQSEFFFLYSPKLIDVERKVNIDAENEPIKDILTDIFGEKVKFAVYDRQVVLTPEGQSESLSAFQQNSITGIVTDKDGSPLPGVNVVVTGTTNGVITDTYGKYSIGVPQGAKSLTFSFIGMESQEISIGTLTQIIVTMAETAIGLEEVVVIGYGSVQKRDLTGSVAQLPFDKLKNLNITRVEDALNGQLAGVQVITNSGQPGDKNKIRIRGVGSITAGADPLFVVDGFPVDDMQMINPNDVETIDVLKDASATAIYGSRGANGVIIVTTKRGKAGKSIITLDTYFGQQKIYKGRKFLTSQQQAEYYYIGVKNQNLDVGLDVSGDPLTWANRVPVTVMDVLEGRNTINSQSYDDIFRIAFQQGYNLSASGGTENFKYGISGGYVDQDGILKNNNFKRYSLRTNLDAQVSKRFSIKSNLTTIYTTKRDLQDDNNDLQVEGNGERVIREASSWHHWYPLYNTDGSYFNGFGTDTNVNLWNPLAQINEITARSARTQILGNLSAEYKVSEALNLNVMLGANIFNYHYFYFQPNIPVFNSVAQGSDVRSNYLNWLTETTLNYKKSFNKHNITGLLGFTTQKQADGSNFISSQSYLNNLVYTLNAVNNSLYQGNSLESQWSLISYLARVNYNYDTKYYLTASIRRDGSSRFGTDKKYGYFPSVALAWRISGEDFLKQNSFINNLKIRLSFGETGNNNIGNYSSISTINYESYPLGGIKIGGYAPSQFANSLLTWEMQTSYNAGIDASILNSRISFAADYFLTRNHNLLLNVNVPEITGFSQALQNIGEVQNKGWEFTLNTKNFVNAFNWSTDFNFSTFQNKVLRLGPEGAPIINDFNITEIGQPMGMFYGYVVTGIFKNQAELDAGPVWNPGFADHSRVGDIRLKDVSGPGGIPDGIVNTFDRTIMGSPYPNFYYGMTNTFSYKNLGFMVNLQGSHGNMVYNIVNNLFYSRSRHKQFTIMENYWKSEADPGDGVTPRPNNNATGGFGQVNSFYLRSGTYLRINNISLSYSFSDKITKKLTLSSLRVYITATNPLLITKNNLFNPESDSYGGNPLTPGLYNNDYPIAKSYKIGLNVSF